MPQSRGLGVLGENLLDLGKEVLAGVADFALSVVDPAPDSPLGGTGFDNMINRGRDKLPFSDDIIMQLASLFLPVPKTGLASRVATKFKSLRRQGFSIDEAIMKVFPRAAQKPGGKVIRQSSPEQTHRDLGELRKFTDETFSLGHVDPQTNKFLSKSSPEVAEVRDILNRIVMEERRF